MARNMQAMCLPMMYHRMTGRDTGHCCTAGCWMRLSLTAASYLSTPTKGESSAAHSLWWQEPRSIYESANIS